jgi:hypothetical protein
LGQFSREFAPGQRKTIATHFVAGLSPPPGCRRVRTRAKAERDHGKENAMKAVFKGIAPVFNDWSNADAWVGGAVPLSDRELKVQLDVQSTEDLGNAQAPFFTDDVIGVAGKLGFPSLDVTGFLHADTVRNLANIELEGSAAGIIAHQLKNVAFVAVLGGAGTVDVSGNAETHTLLVADEGSIHIHHNLIGGQSVQISFGGVVEVGHKFGNPDVTFGISGGTLILDHAPPKSLGSHILFSLGTTDKIELGHLDFDAAAFIPSAVGSLSGKVQLTEHGKPVYQLSDVSFPVGAGRTFSVGTDPATGFHFIAH